MPQGQEDGKYRYSNLFFVYRYFSPFVTENLLQISICKFKICPIDTILPLCIDIHNFCFYIDIPEQKSTFFEGFYRYRIRRCFLSIFNPSAPNDKTILIDGGGSQTYDVGKNTLIPYLLDRKIKKIDYVIVSHFDEDHVGRNFECAKRIKSWESYNW